MQIQSITVQKLYLIIIALAALFISSCSWVSGKQEIVNLTIKINPEAMLTQNQTPINIENWDKVVINVYQTHRGISSSFVREFKRKPSEEDEIVCTITAPTGSELSVSSEIFQDDVLVGYAGTKEPQTIVSGYNPIYIQIESPIIVTLSLNGGKFPEIKGAIKNDIDGIVNLYVRPIENDGIVNLYLRHGVSINECLYQNKPTSQGRIFIGWAIVEGGDAVYTDETGYAIIPNHVNLVAFYDPNFGLDMAFTPVGGEQIATGYFFTFLQRRNLNDRNFKVNCLTDTTPAVNIGTFGWTALSASTSWDSIGNISETITGPPAGIGFVADAISSSGRVIQLFHRISDNRYIKFGYDSYNISLNNVSAITFRIKSDIEGRYAFVAQSSGTGNDEGWYWFAITGDNVGKWMDITVPLNGFYRINSNIRLTLSGVLQTAGFLVAGQYNDVTRANGAAGSNVHIGYTNFDNNTGAHLWVDNIKPVLSGTQTLIYNME